MLMLFRLMELYGLSDAQLGLILLPVTLVMALVSPLAGRGSDGYGAWPVMTTGFIFLMVSALIQSSFSSTLPLYWVMTALVLMGRGGDPRTLCPGNTGCFATVTARTGNRYFMDPA